MTDEEWEADIMAAMDRTYDNSEHIANMEAVEFWKSWKHTRPSNGKRRNGGAPIKLNKDK